jgi:alpha-mannosidase
LAAIDQPGTVRLRVHRQPLVTVLAHASQVPGYGWTAFPGDRANEPAPVFVAIATTTGASSLENGLLRVEIDPSTGTFSINGHSGMGRLVDGGDCGDTYNWCPPADDTLVDTPDAVDVEVVEDGPLRARVAIRATYGWPERCQRLDRRVGEVPHTITTTLELRAGESVLRVEVSLDNRSRDHRLRSHFPLPEPASVSLAECAFAVVERGREAEGGPTEAPLATYPARRFVQAGGLTLVHDRLAEYELVGTQELALTLLRASGMLSQGPMSTRPLPAGPLIPLEGSQLLRPVKFRYAVALGDIDPFALADEVLVPLQTVQGEAGGELPPVGTALTIEGAEVSAVRREGGGLRVRVYNPAPEPATVTLPGRQGWLVDLRGRPLEAFEEQFNLRPWGIATLAL